MDARHCVMPPLLAQQKPLIDRVEWPSLPSVSCKPLVLRKRLDAAGAVRVGAAPRIIFKIAQPVAQGLIDELELLVGRKQEVLEPIAISLRKRGWRNSAGEASQGGMQWAIERWSS